MISMERKSDLQEIESRPKDPSMNEATKYMYKRFLRFAVLLHLHAA
jgi:hypothetical protein